MTRWFRFYTETLDHPKAQRLSGEAFKAWVNLLCVAARKGGEIPNVPADLAFSLRTTEQKVATIIDGLVSAELLDVTETGWTPHNWNERQHLNDVSTDRVKRFRKRKVKRDETVSETRPEQSTEQNTDSVAKATGGLPPLETEDLKTRIFGPALDWLEKQTRKSPEKLRPLVGKWCSTHGDGRTLEALQQAAKNAPLDPVPYIEKLLSGQPPGRPPVVDLDKIFGPKEATVGH